MEQLKPAPLPLEEVTLVEAEGIPQDEEQQIPKALPFQDALMQTTPKFDTEYEPAHNENISESLSRRPSEVVEIDEVLQADSPQKLEEV